MQKSKIARVNKDGVYHFLEEVTVRMLMGGPKKRVYRRLCRMHESFFWSFHRGSKELELGSDEVIEGTVTCKNCLKAMGLLEKESCEIPHFLAVRHKTSKLYVKREAHTCNSYVEHPVNASLYKSREAVEELTKSLYHFDGEDNLITKADYDALSWRERHHKGYYNALKTNPTLEIIRVYLSVE